jgi:hypothetical protein
MTSLPEELIRQTPSPLPPLPEKDCLSPEQWSILLAIADTVVPSFTSEDGNRLLQHPLRRGIYKSSAEQLKRGAGLQDDHGLVAAYLAENPSSVAEFKSGVARVVNVFLHEQARKELLFVLSTLR